MECLAGGGSGWWSSIMIFISITGVLILFFLCFLFM